MIRLLIVTDVRLYAEGLQEVLSHEAELEVVGTAPERDAAVALLCSGMPNVVLLDAALPQCMLTARALLEADPTVKLVALAVPETEEQVLACAKAGASAYVTRDASVRTLVETLLRVTRGELLCSPKMAGSLFQCIRKLSTAHTSTGPWPGLTSREQEVAELIGLGCSNKEIARRLSIEVATVKNHVHNLLAKLQVNRRGEATARLRGHLLWEPEQPPA